MGDKLGSGAFGVVRRAYDTVLKREVAIKSVKHDYDARRLKRIEQEVQIHSSLNHPNIVQFYDAIEDQGVIHIVMEYCPNGTVAHAMDHCTNRKLPLDRVRRYMFELGQAVRYMHAKIVVHRDLKPTNMLLDADDHVKLCDFGLATTVNQLKLEGNSICGTTNYISPEVYNQKGVTTVTDVWSYGCVLYALVVGRPPFTSDSMKETVQMAREGTFELPDSVDPHAADLIKKVLNKNIKERPSMATVLCHPFFSSRPKVDPYKCPFRGGFVQVEGDGSMVLDLEGHPTLFIILPGAEKVEVSTRSGSHKKVYDVEALPAKYRGRFEFALKIVKQAQQHKPLVIWNSDSGKYVMFGNMDIGLVRGKSVLLIPENQKQELRTAMTSIVTAVKASGYAKWPVVVGTSPQ